MVVDRVHILLKTKNKFEMILNNQNQIKMLDIVDKNIHHMLLHIDEQFHRMNDEQLNHAQLESQIMNTG
jgi:hypothetical protein